MPIQILMPALSPTMKEGNLAKWLKKEGDKVLPGDVIAEIETDKATMEVESIDEGILAKIIIKEGTSDVKVNEVIAILIEEGESLDDIRIDIAKPETKQDEKNVENRVVIAECSTDKGLQLCSTDNQQRIFASPLAKRIAAEKNIDLSKIEGTGPHGRIIKIDVEKAKLPEVTSTSYQSNNVYRNPEIYRAVPNTGMRKVIAKRLLESKQTIPHFYLSIECNLEKLLALRSEMNSAAQDGISDLKLSVNDFIIKAVACSLRDVPEANSSWTDEAILLYNNVDVSVAVAIEGGLITPIIKNADKKAISEISNEMKDLAKRAKMGSLKPEEFQGGGFSISNLGMYGIKKFEAIVNPPQSAILACGAASKRVIVNEKDEITTAMMCDFSLSCDHRVVDGAVGATFLKSFKKYIESPFLMFI